MNRPAVTCYLTRVEGNPLAKFAKCGTDDEIELLSMFKECGYEPTVDANGKPPFEVLQGYKNSIIYVWLKEESGKRKLSMNIWGIPSETIQRDFDVAAIQVYTKQLSPENRLTIANHMIEKLMGEKHSQTKTKRITDLYEQGCFEVPTKMTCSVSHYPIEKKICPDSKPNPDYFKIVDGVVVEK